MTLKIEIEIQLPPKDVSTIGKAIGGDKLDKSGISIKTLLLILGYYFRGKLIIKEIFKHFDQKHKDAQDIVIIKLVG